jgi:hypothetical protein
MAEMAAVRRQGFISRERRRGQIVFKLRFRMPPEGKQCVRYLGNDPFVAEAMRHELVEIQRIRRLDRELAKLNRQIGRKVRSGKEKIVSKLEQAGYHFHGSVIRRKRVSA